MAKWEQWPDETLVYASDDTDKSGMFLFWADIWLDGTNAYHAILFGVYKGHVRVYADADNIVVDSLEAAEQYLLEEGMTDSDVVCELDGASAILGSFPDWASAKSAIDDWVVRNG